MKGLHWVGVFSDEKIKPAGTPIDACLLDLSSKLMLSLTSFIGAVCITRNEDGLRRRGVSRLVVY